MRASSAANIAGLAIAGPHHMLRQQTNVTRIVTEGLATAADNAAAAIRAMPKGRSHASQQDVQRARFELGRVAAYLPPPAGALPNSTHAHLVAAPLMDAMLGAHGARHTSGIHDAIHDMHRNIVPMTWRADLMPTAKVLDGIAARARVAADALG